ncbi:glycosyltransferase [Clostridium tertium]|uniref:Glycosyl transferase family 2 n=1 Tax=Clostridium tertium TaxID=1559 RepID=A0A6N3DMQ2_9CLOT
MNTLSVCIISDNEESNLTRCLKSLKDIADEIILIDIGFVDYTSKIAEKFNAKVIKFPWDNNYSSARNKALEVAKMDWILSINSNEALDSSQIDNLKKLLSKSHYIGYRVKIINIINNTNFDGGYYLRIIRNKSGFYYKGRIDEVLYNKEDHINEIKNTDYYIYNFSFNEDEGELLDRFNKNLTIYQNYEMQEKDFIYYYNLGNEFYIIKKFDSAIENYLISMNLSNNFYINSYLNILIIKTYYNMKEYNKAIEFFKENEYGYFREIFLLLSFCYKLQDDLDKYKEYMKLYLSKVDTNIITGFNLNYIQSDNIILESMGFNISLLLEYSELNYTV